MIFGIPLTFTHLTFFNKMAEPIQFLCNMLETLTLEDSATSSTHENCFPFPDLPLELQRLVLDTYFAGWTVELSDRQRAESMSSAVPTNVTPYTRRLHVTDGASMSAVLLVNRHFYKEAKPIMWRGFDQAMSLTKIVYNKTFVRTIPSVMCHFNLIFTQIRTIKMHFGQFSILHGGLHDLKHHIKDLFPQLGTIEVSPMSWTGIAQKPNADSNSMFSLLLNEQEDTDATASMCIFVLEQHLKICLRTSRVSRTCLMHGMTLKADVCFNLFNEWPTQPYAQDHCLPGDELIVSIELTVATKTRPLTTRLTKKRFETSLKLSQNDKKLKELKEGEPLPEAVKIDETNTIVFEPVEKQWKK